MSHDPKPAPIAVVAARMKLLHVNTVWRIYERSCGGNRPARIADAR